MAEERQLSGRPVESSTVSVWTHTAETRAAGQTYETGFPSLQGELTADVAVVGAGITGITTALLLQQAGKNVVLLDAHPVGYGVSGFNSGHLTSLLLDMSFQTIIANFGEEPTRTIALGLQEAIDFIERTVRDERIDCNFQRLSGYLYAEKASQVKALQAECEAATRAGLVLNRTQHVPLPFDVAEGLRVADQARFHPLKYVQALAQVLAREGGRVFENSRVMGVNMIRRNGGGESAEVIAEGGRVLAQEVVIATHTPIGLRPGMHTRLEPLRSYIIGVRVDEPIEDAVYWDMDDPYHYIRIAEDEQGPLLIIGGEDHKTGQLRDTNQPFARLEAYARERFTVRSVDYRWSAQLYDPADGLPYIGKLSGTYLATGFSGEGLTCGTLAARVMADGILGIRNDCAAILDPARVKPMASLGGALSENISTAAHFLLDRAKSGGNTPEDIPPGEGLVCKLNGKQAAVYRDETGALQAVSAVCTHLACIVEWNKAEKSWDCPCHGSRFSPSGEVLNGPAVTSLPPIDWPSK